MAAVFGDDVAVKLDDRQEKFLHLEHEETAEARSKDKRAAADADARHVEVRE